MRKKKSEQSPEDIRHNINVLFSWAKKENDPMIQ
jgi:hypothetical protein